MTNTEQTLCVLNPHANLGRGAALFEPLQAELAALAPGLRLEMPDTPAQGLALIAAMPRGSRIIVAGGDGTVQQLLVGLVEGAHALALLPVGTGNDLARVLGVSKLNWRTALRLALQGEAQGMDVGQVRFADGRRRYFASSMACGFDAAAGARMAQMPRFLPGILRYGMAALRQMLALHDYGIRWRLNAEGPWLQEKLMLSSCLNTPTYAGGMALAPRADVWDGRLDLMQLQSTNLLQTLLLFVRMLAGGLHEGSRRVSHWRCESLEVASIDGQPLPLLLDGECLDVAVSAWRVLVQPAGLQVVPRPVRPKGHWRELARGG